MNWVFIQRVIYILGGLGFAWGASLLMQFTRRSGTTKSRIISSLLVMFIFLFTVFYAKVYSINEDGSFYVRRGAIAGTRNNPPLRINTCDLAVIHKDDALDVISHLNVTNPNDSPLDRLHLKHNTGFTTYNVEGDRVKQFNNDVDAIVVFLTTPLLPGENMEVEISEYGSIRNSRTYLHVPWSMYNRVHREGLTTLGKQVAFIEHDYVLLPAEVCWYPTSYSKYQPPNPGYTQRDLTDFSLEVTTHEGLTVISQGKKTDKGNNTFLFEPETPLTKMSLTIGKYQKISVDVNSVEYSYYWIGKDPFTDCGITSKDVEKSIRIARKHIEDTLQLKYPFKRYSIVETPIHFFGYHSPLDLSGPYEQPEIRFIPESSLALKRYSNPRNGRDIGGVGILTKIVFPRLYQTTTKSSEIITKLNPPPTIVNLGGLWQFATDPFPDYSNILTQYGVFSRGPVSTNDYFNLLAVNWLRSRFFYFSDRGHSLDLNYRSRNNAALQFFSSKSLKDILADETYYPETMDILNMASKTFFNLCAAKSGIDLVEFEKILQDGFATTDVDVAAELSELCGFDVIELFEEFSEQKEKAHYELTDLTVARHLIDDRYLNNARFAVSNPSPYHGLIECSVVADNLERDTKAVYLEPYTKKEIGLVVTDRIRNVWYQWLPFGSKDLRNFTAPNQYGIPVSIDVVDAEQAPFFNGVRTVEQGTVPVSVVMDNLDERCRIISPPEKNVIKRFVNNRRKNSTHLKFEYFEGIRKPPVTWTLARARGEDTSNVNMFFGQFSSCYYTKTGSGESAVEYAMQVPEPGQYDVYLSVPFNLRMMFRGHPGPGDLGETTVRVFADDGAHEDVTDISKADGDWAYVGTYSFSDTTAVIQITDKSNAKIVVADAVKLSKVVNHEENKGTTLGSHK